MNVYIYMCVCVRAHVRQNYTHKFYKNIELKKFHNKITLITLKEL